MDLINGIIVQIDDILDLALTIMRIHTEEKKNVQSNYIYRRCGGRVIRDLAAA